jgi:hypothetical protein
VKFLIFVSSSDIKSRCIRESFFASASAAADGLASGSEESHLAPMALLLTTCGSARLISAALTAECTALSARRSSGSNEKSCEELVKLKTCASDFSLELSPAGRDARSMHRNTPWGKLRRFTRHVLVCRAGARRDSAMDSRQRQHTKLKACSDILSVA